MKKLFSVLILIVVCGFTGCKKDDDNFTLPKKPKMPEDIKVIDVKGAKSLYIGEKEKVYRLYKVDSGNEVEQVAFIGQSGNIINEDIEPLALYRLREGYFILKVKDKLTYGEKGYLINTNDSSIYDLKAVGIPTRFDTGIFKNDRKIKFDKDNNAYYIRDYWDGKEIESNLVKIDYSNPNEIKAVKLTTSTEYIESFEVDLNGNVIFRSHVNNDWGANRVRYRLATGQMYEMAKGINTYWLGLDGQFRFVQDRKIKKLVFDNGVTGEDYVITGGYDSDGNPQEGGVYDEYGMFVGKTDVGFLAQSCNIYNFAEKIVIVDVVNGIDKSSKVIEVENQETTIVVKETSDFGVGLVTYSTATDKFLYLYADDTKSIYKVNPIDYSKTKIELNNRLDLFSLGVDEKGIVYFTALNLDNSKKVMGEIDMDGKVTTTELEDEVKVVMLEKL